MITYSLAKNDDLSLIIEMLSENVLPSLDVHHHIDNFIVAKSNGRIVGTVGIENYGSDGLLRSLAVLSDFKNQKIGMELCDRLTGLAVEKRSKDFTF